jgi:hypothetical protein
MIAPGTLLLRTSIENALPSIGMPTLPVFWARNQRIKSRALKKNAIVPD